MQFQGRNYRVVHRADIDRNGIMSCSSCGLVNPNKLAKMMTGAKCETAFFSHKPEKMVARHNKMEVRPKWPNSTYITCEDSQVMYVSGS